MIGLPLCVQNVHGGIHNERSNVYNDKTTGAVSDEPVYYSVQSRPGYFSCPQLFVNGREKFHLAAFGDYNCIITSVERNYLVAPRFLG